MNYSNPGLSKLIGAGVVLLVVVLLVVGQPLERNVVLGLAAALGLAVVLQ